MGLCVRGGWVVGELGGGVGMELAVGEKTKAMRDISPARAVKPP